MRLTRRGIGTLAAAIVLFVLGVLAGYPLLLAVSSAAIGAVIAAIAVTYRRPRANVVRELYPDRVERGRPAALTLRVHNPASRRQPGFVAVDQIGSRPVTVTVKALAAGGQNVYRNEVPTVLRGRHQVGPLSLHRMDALGLSYRQLSIGDVATLWVYPRTHQVRVTAGGRPRHHHEGPQAELRGSLDLREVREYVVGDEVRHLHWKATARTGQLMIRDYVDPNQPQFTALLDNRKEAPAGQQFEDAVEVAASLVVAAAKADQRCRMVSSSGTDVVTTEVRRLLDELCVLDRAEQAELPLVPAALTLARGGTLVVISSAITLRDRTALASVRSRYADLVVITLGGPDPQVPGAKVLRASGAADAASRWHTVMAR